MSEEHYGQIEQLSAELERLREENRRLREELRAVQANSGNHADAAAPQKPAIATVNKDSSVEEKIALFRSLFGGREDVYAVRWESGKTGKAGYSPGRVRGSGKPTADAKDELLPLDDRVVFDHLAGRKTVGVYPLLKDETCWFLAVDFDKAGIALPLQAGPRRRGNTLFLDHDLQPYPDQWAFLSGVKKIPVGQVEAIVAEAQKAGKVLGVRLSLDEEDTVSPHTPWIKVPPRQENLQIDSLPAEGEDHTEQSRLH